MIERDYGRVWGQLIRRGVEEDTPYIQELNGKLVLWRSIDRRKFVISHFSNLLRTFEKRASVLEMGSGGGINILALAILHPEIKKWHGIELTPEGVCASRMLLKNPPVTYFTEVTGIKADEARKRLMNADIQFTQGNMTALPFHDNAFDIVFSCQAIEQLPNDYMDAFREAGRVANHYMFFLEQFLEAQKNIFQKMYLQNVNYFRASFHEVESLGYRILTFEQFPLSAIHHSHGLLVCSPA